MFNYGKHISQLMYIFSINRLLLHLHVDWNYIRKQFNKYNRKDFFIVITIKYVYLVRIKS